MFAIIDLETTGGSAVRDRITEIAIVVHDGQKVLSKFSSLINPGQFIPSYITDITGIDDEMVSGSPTFRELTTTILEMTEGCVFVAHNVGFDYGFLRESFARLGIEYNRPQMCTVRTTRRVVPGLPSYSLGRLCNQLGIEIYDRHRAMGDAKATVLLLEHLIQLDPNILQIEQTLDLYQHIPKHLDRELLDRIPERPGLYFLHNQEGQTLFAGNSRNVRRDMLKMLRSDKQSKAPFSLDDIHDLSWELTGNELLAALRLPAEASRREIPQVKTTKTRRYKAAVFGYHDQRNYLRLYVGPHRKGQSNWGEFPSPADAETALWERVRRHQLCAFHIGLEEACTDDGCGSCNGAEDATSHNELMESALDGLGFPFPSFFVLTSGRNQNEVSVLCVEKGICIGYAYLDSNQSWSNPDHVRDMLNPFQQLTQGSRILRQFLPKMKRARIVPY